MIDDRDKLLHKYLTEEKGMSERNVEYFLKEYNALSEEEKSEVIYEAVGKKIYKEKPVGIVEFMDDPYFLGDIYDTIFPIWREVAQEVHPAPFLKKYDQVVLSCATRCFGKGTSILMYDGTTKKVEDVVVGDKVMGPDREPRNVLSLAHGTDKLYKVSFPYSDIKEFICNSKHILPLYNIFPITSNSIDLSDFKTITVEDYVKATKTGIRNPISPYSYMLRVHDTSCSYESFEIEELDNGEFFGFELDGDHLFVLGNRIVTHNSGKTTLISILLLYEIYILSCMIDPFKTFVVANIAIALLSKDNSTAVSQIGSELYKGLTQAPYFKGVIRDKLSFSKLDKDGVQIMDNIYLKAGSSLATIIGTNLYAGCIDEANAPSPRIAAEHLIEARMKMYQEMRDRRESSYSKAPKRSGMLLFTSSPTDEGDVLSEIIDNVKENAISGVLIRDDISRWEARNEEMDETFEFFMGSDTKDPCILDGSIELKPEEYEKVIQIPAKEDYYQQFMTNPYLAIQNIAGRRTMPETALFNSVSSFERVFCKDNYIFSKDTPTVQIGSSLTLDDYLLDPNYFSHPEKPDCFRYIHLDMAYKCDRFGLSSVYSDRVKFTDEEGHEIYRRIYYVDFCLGVQSKNKETVDILKVLEFVYSLKERGYPIKICSTDSHQGELARQMIAKRGVRTEYLSMEKTKEQYLNLKNTILTESLVGFKNPALMTELRGLRENAKRIEKGKGYTDDMSDSLAGALWMCSQDRFFKKNNEAISEIIQQTGRMNNIQSPNVGRGFTGLTKQLNRGRNTGYNLGFRYH